MAHDARKNYKNCNHYLSSDAVRLGREMMQAHGNAPFDAREAGYPTGIVDELADQGFLVPRGGGRYCRNKEIIGDRPTHPVRRARVANMGSS